SSINSSKSPVSTPGKAGIAPGTVSSRITRSAEPDLVTFDGKLYLVSPLDPELVADLIRQHDPPFAIHGRGEALSPSFLLKVPFLPGFYQSLTLVDRPHGRRCASFAIIAVTVEIPPEGAHR